MDEDLDLHPLPAERADLLDRGLPWQDDPRNAQTAGGLHSRLIVNVHLCRRMQFKVRQFLTDAVAETDVLQQQRIRIVFIEEAGIGQRRFHFILIDQCIHRHIDAYAVAMGIPDRLCHLFSVKVPGKGTGTKGISTQINGITASLYRCDQRFHSPGRGQKLYLSHDASPPFPKMIAQLNEKLNPMQAWKSCPLSLDPSPFQ